MIDCSDGDADSDGMKLDVIGCYSHFSFDLTRFLKLELLTCLFSLRLLQLPGVELLGGVPGGGRVPAIVHPAVDSGGRGSLVPSIRND